MEKAKTHHKLHQTEQDNFYPKFVVKNNENPNSLYAFPFVGLIVKAILLIPAFFYLLFVSIAFVVVWLITPFVILFTGKYWNTAYTMTLGYMVYKTKVSLFVLGLTDKYPGFNLDTNGIFELTIKKPTTISRWLAFPVAGFVIRMLLLIPYYIYKSVLDGGTFAAMVASWFAILGKGKYPESLYEFNRDSLRVSLAFTSYLTYMSDKYPNFWISMKHKNTKIILIVIGAILFLMTNRYDNNRAYERNHQMRMDHKAQNEFPFNPNDY